MRTLKEIQDIVEAYVVSQRAFGDAVIGKGYGADFAVGVLAFRLAVAIHDQDEMATAVSLNELTQSTAEYAERAEKRKQP